MQFAFVNYPMETFTPTQSGALATIIWECCRAAEAEGLQPLVITQAAAVEPFNWSRTTFITGPVQLKSMVGHFFQRAERKLSGWRHFGQVGYTRRVLSAIESTGAGDGTLFFFNDPETLPIVRKQFPKAKIVHWFQNQLPAKATVQSKFAASVDVVLAVSDFTSRWIENHYGLAPGQVRTVNNAVDLKLFHAADELPSGFPVINFVGRTGIEKAPDLLLSAAIKLAEKTKDFAVQIIGSNHWDRFVEDGYQRKLTALSQELEQMGIVVRRVGHVSRDHLPGELRKAQIHVTPSRWDEPFGMTTIEGMACGLAIIASRTGGTPEVVGDAGLLFQRDSVDELACCLKKLVIDAGMRREYQQRAIARSKDFAWSRTWAGIKQAAL